MENEVGLLLDLARAKVTAHGTNTELREYLSLLPLSLVRELHVVGTRSLDDGTLRDNHLEMDSDDYNILEWVLDRTSPMIITLEYGGFGDHFSWRSSKSAIKRQLEAISSILGERKKSECSWNEIGDIDPCRFNISANCTPIWSELYRTIRN